MKKILCLLLAFVMLSGCGSAGNGEETAAAPAKEETAAASAEEKTAEAASTAQEADNTAETAKEAPAAEEVVNITVAFNGDNDGKPNSQAVVDAMNAYSSEKIGVTFTLVTIPGSEYGQKMSMALATKEDYDLLWTAHWMNAITWANEGATMDLSELLPNYPELYNVMPEDVWVSTEIGGGRYMVPNYKETGRGVSILTPVAMADAVKEATGIDFAAIEVNSIRDYYKMEEYILACMDIGVDVAIPHQGTFQNIVDGYDPVYEALGNAFYFNKETGKAEYIYELPEYREYVTLANDWQKKGIWLEEQMMSDYNDLAVLESGNYAIFTQSTVPDMANNFEQRYGVPVYVKNVGKNIVSSTSATGSGWAIPAYSAKAEAALKWLELVNTDTAFADMFLYGVEGENYTRDADGIVTLNPDTEWKPEAYKCTNAWVGSLTSSDAVDKKEQYTEFNAMAEPAVLLGFRLNSDAVINEITACNAVYNETGNMLAFGFYGPEEIDKGLEKVGQTGLETVRAELQKQIDEFLSAD